MLRVSSIFFSLFERFTKRRRHEREFWYIYFEYLSPSSPIFRGVQCFLGKHQARRPSPWLWLWPRTLMSLRRWGAHLRRKRVAITSSWMRDERVNQSLVAFSRCCMPHYMPIQETGRERGFYLIGRKFPLLGNLLFTQDHLGEAVLPHNSIIADPVSSFYQISNFLINLLL